MRKPSFTIEQLRSFMAVAETEHVSNAAASLFLTQGAVTQQLRHFERALGLHLLERDGRGVRLTDAGRGLSVTCRAALRALEVLEETAQSIKHLEAGSLHVGASPTCASYYLPTRLAEFLRRFPNLKLHITIASSSPICTQVLAGALDCAIIEGEPPTDLRTFALALDELILVAKADHPLAQLTRVTAAQLAKYRYIGRDPSSAAEHTARGLVGDAYTESETLNLGHPDYVRAAVVAGLGYAALPLLAVEADLASGILKRLSRPSSQRSIHAVRRQIEGGPTLEEFWNHLTGTSVAS